MKWGKVVLWILCNAAKRGKCYRPITSSPYFSYMENPSMPIAHTSSLATPQMPYIWVHNRPEIHHTNVDYTLQETVIFNDISRETSLEACWQLKIDRPLFIVYNKYLWTIVLWQGNINPSWGYTILEPDVHLNDIRIDEITTSRKSIRKNVLYSSAVSAKRAYRTQALRLVDSWELIALFMVYNKYLWTIVLG